MGIAADGVVLFDENIGTKGRIFLRRLAIGAALSALASVGPAPVSAQAFDIAAIQNLKCLTNDTIGAGDAFPASSRRDCNGDDPVYKSADTAIASDNFRITYNPYGNLGAVAGNAVCLAGGACDGGDYQLHDSPDNDFKNVRVAEGSGIFLAGDSPILGEDVIVHLPKGYNGPQEHEAGIALGEGTRDVIVMLHGGGGLGEAALSQLANLRSIQDLHGNGPVLLVPNAGNSLKMLSHQWAWDAWSPVCQTGDSSRMGKQVAVSFRKYPSSDTADPFDDGFDDACASDLRRLLKLAYDLKTNNKWVRRMILAGFSSGGHMAKTVMCTYPGAYDGYAMFEHGDLIGVPGQQLCGNLDQGAAGYAGFLSRRLDSLLGVRPQDLAAAKRPLFQVCSDQDNACSNDLGSAWKLVNGVAGSLITDPADEKDVYDHTVVGDSTRLYYALERYPDSADLSSLARGQYSWKLAGLEFRAQTTLAANLPPSAGSMVDPNTVPPPCADAKPGAGNPAVTGYDAALCSFADANPGGGPGVPDDKTFLSVLAVGKAGEAVVSPPEDIFAVRYAERLNGGAYGYIEVRGGGHTVHGINTRADFGKTRDFDTFIELLKFMNYAYTAPTPVFRAARERPSAGPAWPRTFSGTVRFGDRNPDGRKVKETRPVR